MDNHSNRYMIFLFWKTSSFPGKFNSFTCTLIQSFSIIHVLKSSCIYLRIFTPFYKQWSFHKKYRIFWVVFVQTTQNIFISNLLMNSPTFHMLTIFQNNLYSQVTGKLRNKYQVCQCVLLLKTIKQLMYGFVTLKQCT